MKENLLPSVGTRADDLKEELSSSADHGSVRPNGVQATPLDTVGLPQGRGEAHVTDSAGVTDGHQGLVDIGHLVGPITFLWGVREGAIDGGET